MTLPLSGKAVFAGMTLMFARSLGEFGATIILAGNIPGVTQTIPLAIYEYTSTPGGDRIAALPGVDPAVLRRAAGQRRGLQIARPEVMRLTVSVQKKLGQFQFAADFDLTGHRVGLFGPSGSGKSTLMHLLAGLLGRTAARSAWTTPCCLTAPAASTWRRSSGGSAWSFSTVSCSAPERAPQPALRLAAHPEPNGASTPRRSSRCSTSATCSTGA